MARRFTSTEKWQDPWFCGLTNEAKLLFLYLCDNCSIAGFYEKNPKIMLLHIPGINIDETLHALEKSVVTVGDWCFVKNFVKHQKNTPLNPTNRCHGAILKELALKAPIFGGFYGNELSPFLAPRKPLARGLGIGKGINTDPDPELRVDTNAKVLYNTAPTTPLGYFYHKYKQTTGEDYLKGQKDKDIIVELGAVNPGKLISLIDRFFSSPDDFIKKAGYTLGVFKSQINKLMGQAPSKLTAKDFLEGK